MFSRLTFAAVFSFLFSLILANPVLTPTTDLDLPTRVEARQVTSPGACGSVFHLMIAAGCHQPCPSDVPDLLGGLIQSIQKAFPGLTEYYVPYNNSTSQVAVSTPLMINAINQYVQSCPTTPIMFLGYSLGAIIINNALCGGLPSSVVPHVISATFYGDETFVAKQSYDLGTCKTNAPLYSRVGSVAQCQPYASVIRSWCNYRDGMCCGTGNVTLYPRAHFQYATDYNSAVLAFMKSQYAAYKANPTL